MQCTLITVCPQRFSAVRQELQDAWIARMQLMLKQIGRKTILLWFADDVPQSRSDDARELGLDPLFITAEMMDEITPHATQIVRVIASKKAQQQGLDGKRFGDMEALVADQVM
jgi:hypothetical protein